ncbi:hypothetical protein HJG60_009488 [Phyllostomus discolor]|uniref:Uncharacterized protein n=1 Tax=Phyllostomus discolor TaxID=89673 RepID=A0A833YG63_9CHIR|nr:hypothetical protein HJG60_009488 [Phyllostomus discolor]
MQPGNENTLFCKLAQEFFLGKELSLIRIMSERRLRSGSRGSIWVAKKKTTKRLQNPSAKEIGKHGKKRKEVKEQEVRRLDFGSVETEQGNRVVIVKFKSAGECCVFATALCVANIICESSGRVYPPAAASPEFGAGNPGGGAVARPWGGAKGR